MRFSTIIFTVGVFAATAFAAPVVVPGPVHPAFEVDAFITGSDHNAKGGEVGAANKGMAGKEH